MAIKKAKQTGSYILDFQRFEFKYLMTKSRVDLLIPELLRFMCYDPYSAGDYYPIGSVYFDTFGKKSFYEKIAGIEERKKLRIRSYTKKARKDTIVFFEIKEKIKDIMLKRRFPVLFKDIQRTLSGRTHIDKGMAYEWLYHIKRESYKPEILVEYDRLAFITNSKNNLRITIDKNLRYANMDQEVDFSPEPKLIEVMKENCIVEIKFREFLPSWVSRMIKSHNMQNQAFSKFCETIIYDDKLQKSI